MCMRFQDGEKEYLDWIENNPRGYVFNAVPAYRVLHRAGCSHLLREDNEGSRTAYEKVCCTDDKCIREYIEKEYGAEREGWKHCEAKGTDCW